MAGTSTTSTWTLFLCQTLTCVMLCRVVAAGSSATTAPYMLLVKAGPSCTRAASPTTTRACPPPPAPATSQCPLWIPEDDDTPPARPDQRGQTLSHSCSVSSALEWWPFFSFKVQHDHFFLTYRIIHNLWLESTFISSGVSEIYNVMRHPLEQEHVGGQ